MNVKVLTVCPACKPEFDKLLAQLEASEQNGERLAGLYREVQERETRNEEYRQRSWSACYAASASTKKLLGVIDFLTKGEDPADDYKPEDKDRARGAFVGEVTRALAEWKKFVTEKP
jgi:hypothetical protein